MSVLNRAKASRGLKARKARLVTGLETTEEGRKRLVQSAKQLLHGGSIEQAKILNPLLSILFESTPLSRIAHRLAGMLIHMPTMLQCLVVKQARLAQDGVERLLLLGRRIQTILVCPLHLYPFLAI